MKNPPPRRLLGIAIGVAVATAVFWRGEEARTVRPEAATGSRTEVGKRAATPAVPFSRTVLGAKTGRPWEDVPDWDRLEPRQRIVALLSRRLALETSGAVEILEVARDELYVAGEGIRPIAMQADADSLVRQAEAMRGTNGRTADLVFYKEGRQRDDSSRRVLNGRVLLRSGAMPVADAMKAAKAVGCGEAREVAGLHGYVVAEDRRLPGSSLLSAADLAGKKGIASALPLLGSSLRKAGQPTKATYFKKQWHLQNTGQAGAHLGIDVNVVPAWSGAQGNGPLDLGYRGKGVLIGVVDDYVQSTHPDLSPHFNSSASVSLVADDIDFVWNDHGTCVAGLAAASGIGAAGVAPEASIAGIWLLAEHTIADEVMEAEALLHKNNEIQVKNNSWTLPLTLRDLGTLGPAVLDALEEATISGRDGKGEILMFAAGNGYDEGKIQGNKSGFSNNYHVLAVSAVSPRGSIAYYSEFGAHLVTCAPSSGQKWEAYVTTTDNMGGQGENPNTDLHPNDLNNQDYTQYFSGTSAATGITSGVVALILEANPNLGWRDVKEILLRSGTKVDEKDLDWTSRTGGNSSLPLIKHHHCYGGGMVNATAAVALAKKWINLDPMVTQSLTTDEHRPIPDNSAEGVAYDFAFPPEAPMRVEAVEVMVDMRHRERGTVVIDLQSPSGVISHLAYYQEDDHPDFYHSDDDTGYPFWTFSSSRHWGESSQGTWKVIFRDLSGGQTGSVESVTVRLHGVAAPPAAIDPLASTQDTIFPLGTDVTLRAAVSGLPDRKVQWLRGTTTLSSGANETLHIGKMTTAATGQYSVKASNLTNPTAQGGITFSVGAVDTTSRSVVVNEWNPVILVANAAGPGIKYQWLRNGLAIADSAGWKGTNKARLELASVERGDADVYTCEVMVGNARATTGAFDVQVRVKPIIEPFEFVHTIVSDTFAFLVPMVETLPGVDGNPTRYTITGLPSGLTYNASTGWITGRPNVGSTKPYSITIKVSNAAGDSSITRLLSVDPPAPASVGTFSGLVAPDNAANKGLGGSISVVCSSAGVFSGKLALGPTSYPLAGRLDVTRTTDPKGKVLVKRVGRIDPMELNFWISKTDGHLTGTIRDATTPFLTNLEGWQNPYSLAKPAGGIAATYNAWMEAPESGSAPPVGTVPEGTSCGVFRVSPTGGATWIGHTADSALISGSSTISADGSVPVHVLLYGGTGSLHGWAQATDVPNPGLNTMSGNMRWVKLPQAQSTRSYHDGFVVPDMEVNGGQYVMPAAGTVLWGIKTQAGGAYTSLLFAKAGVESASSYTDLNAKRVRVSSTHEARAVSPNPTVLLMLVSPTSGWFWGTATIKDSTPALVSRRLAFVGLMCPGASKGRGYFIVPSLPDPNTSPLLSGTVELVAP